MLGKPGNRGLSLHHVNIVPTLSKGKRGMKGRRSNRLNAGAYGPRDDVAFVAEQVSRAGIGL